VTNNDVQAQFGTVVRAWRSRLGISQEELAGRAGLHRTYVSDVERGTRNVSLASIDKLAAALEVSVATLFAQVGNASGDGAAGRSVVPDELVDILFVEDRPEDVELTLRALKSANFKNRISVVRDGAEALGYLFGTGEPAEQPRTAKLPNLILLDLGLPKVSGLDVLRRIKGEARTANIPVIVLTASSGDKDAMASRRLGADAYIVKPVGFQNLSEVVPQVSLHWALLKSPPVATA
jgi:CheY-like chemotaxis protein/DNA-binding XRE family transcriptional regulator